MVWDVLNFAKSKVSLVSLFSDFADIALKHARLEDEHDDYNIIMAKALADRLAEVCTSVLS